MIIREYSLGQMPGYPFEHDYDISRIAFFDIETTGFAADSSYLYLIGAAYYKDNSFHLIQWFSEGIREEALIISSFFEFLKAYDVLFHYNGSTFDIPYLQRKISMLQLDCTFGSIQSFDIYKKLLPYKKIFKLDSLKLKSLEIFLHIRRQDTFSGGDLIQVYQSYLGRKKYETLWQSRNPGQSLPLPAEADNLLGQILLHNADDIRGLLLISPVLYYTDIFEKSFRILQAEVDGGLLHIRLQIAADLPVPVSYGNDLVHLAASGDTATLSVHIYEGELKYFYENYKDYYYLPAEDYAIHKSVAGFVDKDYRVKAKPATCYTRKQGIFAPQYEPLISPYFKLNHQDKLSFLEIHTDFLLQEEKLEQYAAHLLAKIIAG